LDDGFSADDNASFCQEFFDISLAEIESIVEPDGMENYVRRESMASACIHLSILPKSGH
jgi:hypothetical protein